MRLLRKLILLAVIGWGLWFLYGTTFQQEGVTGVAQKMSTEVHTIFNSKIVKQGVEKIEDGISYLTGKLNDKQNEKPDTNQPPISSPKLEKPKEQSFSVNNIELGEEKKLVKKQVGEPKQSTMNEYGVHWEAYHEKYHNFFMIAYDQNHVAGLYTNQDLLSSSYGIKIGSDKKLVDEKLGTPIQYIRKGLIKYRVHQDEGYEIFRNDGDYVTIFYDQHNDNKVTAIQIIAKKMEEKKEAYYGDVTPALNKGFTRQLFALTNAARVKRGISPLTWNSESAKTAQKHSKDMAGHHYFSHTNLQGLSPFERLSRDGIGYRLAGENLATGQSSSIYAHQGLMNSLGHRKNILRSGYKTMGVGVAMDQDRIPYFTEEFVTK